MELSLDGGKETIAIEYSQKIRTKDRKQILTQKKPLGIKARAMEKKNHIQSQERGKAALRHKRQLKQHPSKYMSRPMHSQPKCNDSLLGLEEMKGDEFPSLQWFERLQEKTHVLVPNSATSATPHAEYKCILALGVTRTETLACPWKNDGLQTAPGPDPMDNVYRGLSQRCSDEEVPPLKIQVPATPGTGDLQECQGQIWKMVNISYKVLFALAIWTMTTEAFPKGAERTKCHLAKYKSLPPRELEAFKKAKDKFENKISFYFFLESIKARAMEKRGNIHRPEGGQAILRKKKGLNRFPSKHAPRKNDGLQTAPGPDPMDNVYRGLSQRCSDEEVPPLKIQVPATPGTGDLQECQGQIWKMVNVSYKVLFALAIWTMTTEAFPKGAERTKCHLAKYKSLPPRELEAFKKAKDKFEDMMLLSDRKCSTRIFHRNWEVKELSVHDRVILVEKELDFATNVLENVEDPSLSKLLSRPLEILTQIRGDLRDCVSIQCQISLSVPDVNLFEKNP
ncbi:hypothetical protein KIL84_012951 [Mauremys mutica]|uniref:Uncharacterized protein n=1 Tax=Mauremys mutica TaxID=74926 RepID=A0A9D4B932_9SAUR|nr:hypothetical protein KIL84_012951 [Mauremys mutica]